MQSSNNVSNQSAQMTLSYVISLNLIKDSNSLYPRAKHIEPCSKMHKYRSAKISAERHQRTHCLDSDVIHARVSSGLLVAADVSSQHSSLRTFGAPRSMSTRHLRQGVPMRIWSVPSSLKQCADNEFELYIVRWLLNDT